MNHEGQAPSDLRLQAQKLRHGGWRVRTARSARYVRFVYRLYLGLLLFVIVAGLPIIGITSLRQRLQLRVGILREALLAGQNAVPPVVAKVGENTEPFPKEYEIPLQTWYQGPDTFQFRVPVFRSGIELDAEASATAEEQTAVDASQAEEENAIEFRQGDTEREAYDLVLKSSEVLAGMVQGKDSSLRFVKWAAARRDEDTYWVDVTFTRNTDGSEARYIWQVNMASKKVLPLSSLARALGRS